MLDPGLVEALRAAGRAAGLDALGVTGVEPFEDTLELDIQELEKKKKKKKKENSQKHF